jgi:hypothetical protein
MADDVCRYLRNEEVTALPDGPVRKASRWVSKHRMGSLALILSLALVGAGATIGSLLLGQSRVAALHARELRVSELETESAIQAQLVDRELSRYELALEKLVGAAQRVLVEPALAAGGAAGAPGPYFDEQFQQGGAGPADLGPSQRYGKAVSVLAPVVSLAPGVSRESAAARLRALGGDLAPALREVMIDSAGGSAHKMSVDQERDTIAAVGVPALRAVVAFADGATLTFPGAAGVPAADMREDPTYKLVGERAGVFWGTPVTREGPAVLPVGAGLYDDAGFQGVAILEVSLDRLLGQPGSSRLDYVQSKLLVTRGGKVMAEDNGPAGRAPLAPQVLDAIAMGRSGSVETAGDGHTWLTTFYPLASMDWYFVAIADVPKMLASEVKIATSDPRKVIAAAKAALPVLGTTRATAAPRPREVPDAGVDAGVDAGAVDAGLPRRIPGPMPVAPTPSATPSAAPLRNPFDKWKEYEKAPAPK